MLKKSLSLSIILFLLFSLSGCEKNGEENKSKGDVFYSRGDYENALSVYKQEAKRGDSHALLGLCKMYEDGKGVKENDRLAFQYCMQAAKRGEVKAQKRLGMMYYKGTGVARNVHEARFWFNQAALSDDPEALYYLGIAYLKGIGGEKDFHQAHDLFERAADEGHVNAMWKLYEMFNKGTGVRQDRQEAFKWLMKLAADGDIRAQFLAGSSYLTGNGVKADPAEAVRWFEKAAQQGSVDAQTSLVLYYLGNEPVRLDEARSWAAKLENQTGSRGVGAVFRRFFTEMGEWPEPERTHERIKDWFDSLFSTKDPELLYGLGFLYELGYQGQRDMDKALALYKRAAALGNVNAIKKLKELQSVF